MIQKSCSLFSDSLFFLFFFPLLLALFYNTLSARCYNQLRASASFFLSKDNVFNVLIQALPNPFFIYNFILYCYFCHMNGLTLSIFIFVRLLLYFIIMIYISVKYVFGPLTFGEFWN